MRPAAIVLVPILIGYFLGAIPTALLIARGFGVADLRRVGSGNLGATNVWRSVGAKAGVLAFTGDIAKGVLSVLLARYWYSLSTSIESFPIELGLVVVGLAAVLGHVYSVFTGFRGGKGVATGFGVTTTLLPFQTLVAVAVFLLVVTLWKYISLGSMAGAGALATVLVVQKLVFQVSIADIYVWFGIALAVLVLVTHRQNIVRLRAGTENRFSFSSHTKAGSHV